MSDSGINDRIELDACWNRIGERGNKQCPELARNVHCYNCETYAKSGRKLLERRLPAGYAQHWGRLLAEPDQQSPPGQISVLLFRVGPEWLAVPTRVFVEVVDIRPVHVLPHRSNDILRGLVNVRGELQLCFAIGRLLGIDKEFRDEERDSNEKAPRMLIASINGEVIAFFANEVYGTYLYNPAELRPLPATLPKEAGEFSKGLFDWQDRHVAVLDESMLIERLIEKV